MDSRSVRVPFDDKVVLKLREDQCQEQDIKYYQERVGSPGWLGLMTRPDLAFTVSRLAQLNANPPDLAIECANHAYRYLKGTDDWGILFSKNGCQEPQGYTDATWGDSNSQDRR